VKIDLSEKLPKKRIVKKKKKTSKKGSVEGIRNSSNEPKKSFFVSNRSTKLYGTYAYPSPRDEIQPKKHNFKPEEPMIKGAVISYRKK
jgi:hypothetical protein